MMMSMPLWCSTAVLTKTLGEIGGGDAADAGHGLAALRADRFHHFGGRIGVEVVDHHAGAFGCELQRHFTANAAARTGDEGGLARVCSCLFFLYRFVWGAM